MRVQALFYWVAFWIGCIFIGMVDYIRHDFLNHGALVR
jgi:hypothetical protein